MKPLALLLTLIFVSGCATPVQRPDTPKAAAASASVSAPRPKPLRQSVAAAVPAGRIEHLAVASLQKESDGVLVVPPVTTVLAVAPEGALMDFYAMAEQGPVRQLGQSRAKEGRHYSVTFTVPGDPGPVLTIWAALSGPGTELPAGPPDGPVSVRVRRAPAGSNMLDLGGFPLFPAFNWHTQLTAQELQEIAQWQGAGWEQGADLIAYSGRLFDISPVEVLQWSMAQGEQAGWLGLGPAGGGASWGMVGTRSSVKVRVNFALGLGGGPPLRPELGYGMLVRVYK